MKSIVLKILFAVVMSTLLASCMTTHTYVGKFKEKTDDCKRDTMIYDQQKQFYVLGGLVPLGMKHIATPKTNCDIKTQMKFTDALLSACTMGFLGIRTITSIAVASEGLTPVKVIAHPKPKKPVRDRGLEVEAEFGKHPLIGLGVLYRFNPYVSLGLISSVYGGEINNTKVKIEGENFDDYYEQRALDLYGFTLHHNYKYAIRGNFRLMKKKLTPKLLWIWDFAI